MDTSNPEISNEISSDTNYIKFCHHKKSSCLSPRAQNPCCLTKMLEMLDFSRKIWNSNQIPFFITHQTLRSWSQYKGISQHDDNICILTLSSYKDKIMSLQSSYNQEGYILKIDQKTNDHIMLIYSENNDNHIDIGFLTPCDSESHQYFIDGELSNKDKSIKSDLIFPLQSVSFYDMEINVPAQIPKFLASIYGNVVSIESSSALPLKKTTLSQKPLDNPYNIYQCFIINNAKRHDRWHHVISECDKHNLCAVRVNAIMGKTLSLNQLITEGKYQQTTYIPVPNAENMGLNEIGVYMSHIECWQRIANLADETGWCLILEDDIAFRPNFDTIMKAMIPELKSINWDLVFLGSRPLHSDVRSVSENLCQTQLSTGCWAYMTTPPKVRKLLDKVYPISYPIDLTLTFPSLNPPDVKIYDDRFENLIEKYTVRNFTNSQRFGIIDELSTKNSDSSSYWMID